MADRPCLRGHGRQDFKHFVDRAKDIVSADRLAGCDVVAKRHHPVSHRQGNFDTGEIDPVIFDQSLDLDQATEVLPRIQAHVAIGPRRRDQPLALVFSKCVDVHADEAGSHADDEHRIGIRRVHHATTIQTALDGASATLVAIRLTVIPSRSEESRTSHGMAHWAAD